MTLPELAIRRPITMLMLLVSLVVIGAIALQRLPLAFLPEGEEPQIWVVVPYDNASPKTMERSILRPIEDALGSIGGLQHMWSNCDGNEARVSLFFQWDEDMATKRIEVRERLDRVWPDLPEDVDEIHISRNWDAGRTGETILEARIASGRDLSHGYELLHTRIVKPLERIPGVASVNLDGVNPREVRVNLKLAELARYNVDVRDVMAALRENNEDRSVGELRQRDRVLMVRVDGSFRELADIENLVVGEGGVRLCDVAEVSYREPPLEYGRHLDGQFALGIDVAREAGANTVEISRAIKERVAEMADDPELEGVNFLIWEDQGAEILKTMRDLRNTGIIGAILASVVLYVFLRRLSSTIFAVLSIPFSLIVACGVVWAKGGTLNTLTLLGLIVGVGMLVDNAIVVMENINRHRENGVPPRKAALIGSREVSVAVLCGTTTSVIVFLPIIFNRPSEMNRYLRELGLTVTFTLIASLFVSQTLIPLAMSRFVRVRAIQPSRWIVALQNGYSRALGFTLRHRWIAPVVGLAIIGSGWFPYSKVDKNFEASEAEMFVSMNYRIDQPMSLERKEELVTSVEEALEPYRRELYVGSIYSFWSENWAMTRCYMEDGHTNETEMNRVRQKLREVAPEIPGVRLEVQDAGHFWQRNSGKRLGFRLSGPDSEVLTDLALDAKRRLETLDGLFDFYTTAEGGRYEVQTRVDRDLAREYGVGVTQAAEVVDYTFRGRRLPRYRGREAVEEVEMSLTLDEQQDESIEQLKNLPLVQGTGEVRHAIPLATVADFAIVQGPEGIQRDNRVSGVWIGARFEEGTEEEHMARCEAVLDDIALPFGYQWDHHSFVRPEQESQAEFLTTLLLALGLIFAVMAALFESMRQALSLMVSLPFAVAGAAWTLYLTGTDFDQPASVGLLLLLGIVVNNGIVMISHINHYRSAGLPREEAMLRGGRERLRPVIMTALTTLLGLAPMVVQRPSLAGVYYYSMALVIMGGLIISTILTTILLPTTVCLTEDSLAAVGRFGRWIARTVRSVAVRSPAPRRAALTDTLP